MGAGKPAAISKILNRMVFLKALVNGGWLNRRWKLAKMLIVPSGFVAQGTSQIDKMILFCLNAICMLIMGQYLKIIKNAIGSNNIAYNAQ